MTAGEGKGGTSQGFEALVEVAFSRGRRIGENSSVGDCPGGGSRAASPWAGPRWIRRCGAVVPVQLHRVLIGLAFTGQRRQIGPGSRAMLGVGEIGEIDGSLTLFVCFPPPHSIIMPCGFLGGRLAASPESVPGPLFFYLICSPQWGMVGSSGKPTGRILARPRFPGSCWPPAGIANRSGGAWRREMGPSQFCSCVSGQGSDGIATMLSMLSGGKRGY